MDKPNESKNINVIYLLKQTNNPENKEDIITNEKLESIYLDIINNNQITIPKINGFQNFMVFFDYIFNKLNIDKESPDKLSKKNEILKSLIEKFINYTNELNDKSNQAKIERYFLDKNFCGLFFEILNKKEDISSFKEFFLLFSKVSILYIDIIIYFRLFKLF